MLGLRYRPSLPTFGALLPAENLARISFTPPSSPHVTYTIACPLDPSASELKMIASRLDRLHQFHLGTSLGIVSEIRRLLKKQVDLPDPTLFRQQVTTLLEGQHVDLKRFARISGLNDEQLTIEDELTEHDRATYEASLNQQVLPA